MSQFENVFVCLDAKRKLNKDELIRALREMISAEMEAINMYTQLADSIDNTEVIELLGDIAGDEARHIGNFQRALFKLDPKELIHYREGSKEASKFIK